MCPTESRKCYSAGTKAGEDYSGEKHADFASVCD